MKPTDGPLLQLVYFWLKILTGNELQYSYTRGTEIRQTPKKRVSLKALAMSVYGRRSKIKGLNDSIVSSFQLVEGPPAYLLFTDGPRCVGILRM